MGSRIAIVSLGAKLGYEGKGYTRFRLLAHLLASRGHIVDLVVGDFARDKKACPDILRLSQEPPDCFSVVRLEEPTPGREFALRHVRGYSAASRKLTAYLHEHPDYDLVYAEVPPYDVGLAAGRFAQKYNIPFVVDVTDLWPDGQGLPFDVPVLGSLLSRPYLRDARAAFDLASGVVGTFEDLVLRAFADRPCDIPHRAVPVGCDLERFDEGVARYATHVDKPDDQYWITYAGSLVSDEDLPVLFDAVALLVERGFSDLRVRVLGSGPSEEGLRALVSNLAIPVDFVGRQPYQKMAAHLRWSDVMVEPGAFGGPHPTGNKFGDYLASGHPIVNSSACEEVRDFVRDREVGLNVTPGDVETLADAIAHLHEHREEGQEMGLRARLIAEEDFDRRRSYRAIVSLVEGLLDE